MSLLKNTQTILIVEDSDDDYEATLRALRKDKNLINPIVRMRDGQSALDHLKGKSDSHTKDRQGVGLMLLDLNMPGMDGRQVLEIVKTDPDLRSIPVVVMTTSDDEKDIQHCYKIGANSYVVKPVGWTNFFEAIARLREYWLEISVLPGDER